MLKIWLLAVFQPIFASVLREAYQLPLLENKTTTIEEIKVSSEPTISYNETDGMSEYPYFANLGHCGGAIVSKNLVVVAAHCVHSFRGNFGRHYKKVIGINNRTVEVERIIIYPTYTPQYKMRYGLQLNDIALLVLSKPLEFNATVQPLTLPAQDEKLDVASKHVVLGRGADDCHGRSTWKSPRHLQQVNLFSSETCYRRIYHGTRNLPPIHWKELNEVLICAERVDGLDFGDTSDFVGPLVKDNVLVGLASYMMPYRSDKIFLTNVAHHVNFINYFIHAFDSIEEYDSSFSSESTEESYSSVPESSEEYDWSYLSKSTEDDSSSSEISSEEYDWSSEDYDWSSGDYDWSSEEYDGSSVPESSEEYDWSPSWESSEEHNSSFLPDSTEEHNSSYLPNSKEERKVEEYNYFSSLLKDMKDGLSSHFLNHQLKRESGEVKNSTNAVSYKNFFDEIDSYFAEDETVLDYPYETFYEKAAESLDKNVNFNQADIAFDKYKSHVKEMLKPEEK